MEKYPDYKKKEPLKINVIKNRSGNQELTIQRNWQHWVHKTQDEDKQNEKHNTICAGHHHTQRQNKTPHKQRKYD